MPLFNIVCPICTEIFQNADDVYSTSCGHLFHYDCLTDWQQRDTSCPQCRSYVSTTHKIYMSFEDTNENLEEIVELELKLKSSNEKITEILLQKHESDENFMHLQEQFTIVENSKRELQNKITEMNDFEQNLLVLQGQYTESSEHVKELEERIEQLLLELDDKTKELSLKSLENETLKIDVERSKYSLSKSILSEKVKMLEMKLKHISDEFQKEVSTSTQLSIEKMKLESYIKHLNATEKAEQEQPVSNQDKKANFTENHSNIKHLNDTEQAEQEQPVSNQNKKNKYRRKKGKMTTKNDLGNNTQTDNAPSSSILIKEFPLARLTLPLENIIVDLAKKINLTITPADLGIVHFLKNGQDNSSNIHLVAEFKSNDLKAKFLAKKHLLKNDPETKSIFINEYINGQLYSLFIYAKEKLRNTEFKCVFYKDNKVFATKYPRCPEALCITSKEHVNKICDENKHCANPIVPEMENNVDEDLYQLE